MKSSFLSRLCLTVFISLFCQFSAAQHSIKANIGSEVINIPLIEKFSDASTIQSQLKALGESLTPPSNRLLAMLVKEENVASALSGQAPKIERYFMIQTLRSHENEKLSNASFAEVHQLIKNNYQSLMSSQEGNIQKIIDSASQKISAQGGKEVALKMGELKLIDIFDERADSISALVLTKVNSTVDGATKEVPLALSISTNKVKGKIVYFYAYSIYKDSEDFDWVKQQTKSWVTQLLATNDANTP